MIKLFENSKFVVTVLLTIKAPSADDAEADAREIINQGIESFLSSRDESEEIEYDITESTPDELS